MTPDLLDLARRAVACKRFLRAAPHTMRLVVTGRGAICWRDDNGILWWNPGAAPLSDPCAARGEWLPCLDDPATIGCLLGLVREVWGDPTLHARPDTVDEYPTGEPVVVWYIERYIEDDHEWLRESGRWGEMVEGHTDPPICSTLEAEALVAALEAGARR